MAKLPRIQNNFTSGELDPLVRGRVDLKQFANGAKNLRNCVPLPQGGFRRRPGLRFGQELKKQLTRQTGMVITAVNGGTTANANDNSLTTNVLTTTNIGVVNPYVLVHYDLGAAATVLFADVVELLTTAGTVAAADVFIQYSTDNVTFTSLGAALTPGITDGVTRRRTGPISARYWRVARIGATDYGVQRFQLAEFSLWVEGSTLSDSRLVDFEFSTTQTFMILFTDMNARVYVKVAGVPTYKADIRTSFASVDLANDEVFWWTQSLDTLIVGHPDVKTMRIQRQSADTEWHSEPLPFTFIPKYAFTLATSQPAVSVTPSAVSGNITLTTSAGFWVAGHVNQIVDGNYGRARIIEITSVTVAKAVVLIPFFDTSAITTTNWTLEAGYEDVWSDSRGWPAAGIFHQDRLVLAGGRSLPNGLGLSKVSEYFDFDPGQAQDDEGIFVIIQADDVPAIYAMKVDRQLQLFTSSAEYYVPQDADSALTPRNISVRRTTARGIKPGSRAINVSGASIFLQRGGKAFREFVFVDTEQAFVASNLSLLSSHLVDDPVDVALRKSTSTDEADLLLAVNQDGTLTVCVTMRDQAVNAWAPQDTDGTFLRCGAVDTDAYFVIERTIGGVARRYFEMFDSTLYVDSAVTYTTGTTLTGLSHLQGETVKVRADDSTLSDEVVAGGQITADRAVVAAAQVGLDYTIDAETLAPAFESQAGPRLDGKKRISRVMLDLFETQDIVVNDQLVTFRTFGSSTLDEAPPIYTGRKVVDGLLGWLDEPTVRITQSAPAPLTVRVVEYLLRG